MMSSLIKLIVVNISLICMISCKFDQKEINQSATSSTPSISDIQQNSDVSIWKIYPGAATKISIPGYYNSMFIIQTENGYGIVNEKNEVIKPLSFSHILYHNGSFAVKTKGKYEFYRNLKESVGQVELDTIYHKHIGNYYVGVKDNLKKIVSKDGKLVSKEAYENISFPMDHSYYFGFKESYWKAYDYHGKLLPDSHPSRFSLNLLNNSKVSLKSVGPIKLGMTKSELGEVIGRELEEGSEGSCKTYYLEKDQISISFLTEKNKSNQRIVERIYISSAGIKTKSGIGVGDSEEKLNLTYPGYLEAERNPYDKLAKDYYFVPKEKMDKKYRINFLVNRQKEIDSYSIGRIPAISYKEGCF